MTRSIDETHDPTLRSWVESANHPGADFPIQNLPFGVFRRRGSRERGRIGVAIGDQVVDLAQGRELGLLDGLPPQLVSATAASSLNALLAAGPECASGLRRRLSQVLSHDASPEARILIPLADVELLLPVDVGDYSDFYASIFHATNVGKLIRPDNPLLPNFRHVPIAYHGRSSSIVVSGTQVRRPCGQARPRDAELPSFGPSSRLDYELEIGFYVGLGNVLGRPVPVDEAEDHIFGLSLLNDWSARDIQLWEYQPLGPFLSKSFATSVAPWVVTLDALAPFRCPAFVRRDEDPHPLPYLSSPHNAATGGFDLKVEALLRSAAMRRQGLEPFRVSAGSTRDTYWTVAQIAAHHTSNGCNMRPGDLLASGTVSGPEEGTQGCLLEKTRAGARPIELPTGEQRHFLADGDEVILRGYCEREGYARIGLGECVGVVLAAPA